MRHTSQHQKRGFLANAVLVFALATCLRVWIGPDRILPEARAQIPDAGMQRKLLVDEVRKTNRLLTEIKEILTSHTLNAPSKGADNQAHPPAQEPRAGE